MSPTGAEAGLSRRDFLIRTGWVAAGSTALASCSWLPALPTFARPDLEDALLWVQALSDGRIRFLCPRSEMGQGIGTGLAQVVAEELNVDVESIEVVVPSTDRIPPVLVTAGSQSMRTCFDPLSEAAATLRETLRERAARKAGVAPESIRDAEGGFALPDGDRVRYAELAGEEPSVISPDPEAATRPLRRYAKERAGAFRRIGRRERPLDVEAIVTGRAVYSRDVVVEGALYGRVARAPRPGAVLANADVEAAKAVPGAIAVVVDPRSDRVGVVAEEPFILERATAALALAWRGGERRGRAELERDLDVERALERDDFEHTLASDGDPRRAASDAVHRIEARYHTSFVAHAPMEPRAGVASVTPERVEVWTGSQDPWYMRGLVARLTGRPEHQVSVHNHRMGGAFGGRKRCQATLEAVWLSSAVGRPVRVQWSREDEFRGNFLQPPFSHRVDAGVDERGRITHWCHDFTACPIALDSWTIPESLHRVADLFGDPGTRRGAVPPYRIANRRIRFSDVRIPIVTGTRRGLGASPNTTAIEVAMDELAHGAGIDPIELRLRNLDPADGRLAAVLRAVATLSNWGATAPAGRGRGVACAVYEGMTYVAVVVEVAVDPTSRAIRATRAWCAQDCGLVVNPDQVEAQIESNIIWGCSMALHERMEIAEGELVSDNFDTYPVLRHHEAPEIEVALLENPDHPPQGVGEPAIAPTPAAVMNAIHAATGRRVRRLPVAADS